MWLLFLKEKSSYFRCQFQYFALSVKLPLIIKLYKIPLPISLTLKWIMMSLSQWTFQITYIIVRWRKINIHISESQVFLFDIKVRLYFQIPQNLNYFKSKIEFANTEKILWEKIINWQWQIIQMLILEHTFRKLDGKPKILNFLIEL